MTGGRVPNEWYARKYQERLKATVAAAPPLTFEAQQLVRRLMGMPAQESAAVKPVKKVRRVCRQAQLKSAYRRWKAGA